MMKFAISTTSARNTEQPHPDAVREGSGWVIEVRDLEHLIQIADSVKWCSGDRRGEGVVLSIPAGALRLGVGLPELELYDDYRE